MNRIGISIFATLLLTAGCSGEKQKQTVLPDNETPKGVGASYRWSSKEWAKGYPITYAPEFSLTIPGELNSKVKPLTGDDNDPRLAIRGEGKLIFLASNRKNEKMQKILRDSFAAARHTGVIHKEGKVTIVLEQGTAVFDGGYSAHYYNEANDTYFLAQLRLSNDDELKDRESEYVLSMAKSVSVSD